MDLVGCPIPSGVNFVSIFLGRNVDGSLVCMFVYAIPVLIGEVSG